MAHFENYCVGADQNLGAAMRRLNETPQKIAFVAKDGKLIGSLTDGDVRRFLLAGGTLGANVCDAAFQSPRSAASRDEAKALLADERFAAIPIVSADGTILDVAFANERLKPAFPKLGIPVAIMAGGKGTRLDPFTRILPKPLIPIGNLPILEHIMRRFSKYGCDDFHIVVNHKKRLIKAYFAENERSYQIDWRDEEKPLGTGGGLSLLRGAIKETFFLTNCDVLLLADFADMLRFHREGGNAVTMVCVCKRLALPYGIVETGDGGEIVAMREKPTLSFQTNAGIYLVEPEVLDAVAPDERIGFPEIIERQQKMGRRVAAYLVGESDWLDMGRPDELEKTIVRLGGE